MAEMIKNKGYLKKGTALFGLTALSTAVSVAPNNPIPVFINTFFNDSDSISILSTTQIRLLAGKKYALRGQIASGMSAIAECTFCWFNVTTSSFIGAIGRLTPSSDTGHNTIGSFAEATIVPSVDTTLELRAYTTAGTITTLFNGTKAIIEEVEAYLPVVPTSYRRGTALFYATETGSLSLSSPSAIPVFTNISFNDSDSIVKLSNTQIKLLKGKKYRLTAQMNVLLQADVWLEIDFYSVTGGAYLGVSGKTANSVSTASYSWSNNAEVFIVPIVDTTIELRILNGTIVTLYYGTKVIVEEIEAYLPVTELVEPLPQPFASISIGAGNGTNFYQTLTARASRGITVSGTTATITKAGYYKVDAQQLISGNAGTYFCIHKNGVTVVHGYITPAQMSDMNASIIDYLNVGDTIRIYIQGSISTSWDGAHSNLSIQYIG